MKCFNKHNTCLKKKYYFCFQPLGRRWVFSQQERTRWPLIFICPDLLFSLFEPLHQADKIERQRRVFNLATAIHLGIYLELERKESCSLQRCVRSCRLARAVVNSSVYCLHRSNSGWTFPCSKMYFLSPSKNKKEVFTISVINLSEFSIFHVHHLGLMWNRVGIYTRCSICDILWVCEWVSVWERAKKKQKEECTCV